MSSLDHTLSPGGGVVFSREYHNELVAKLRSLSRPGRLQIQTSASEVQVHPQHSDDGVGENDYSLVPRHVVVSDVTFWGELSPSEVKLVWTLTDGPGHLVESGGDVVETGPSGSVTWNWSRSDSPARAWDARVDGQKLPVAVEIEVEAQELSLADQLHRAVDNVTDIPSDVANGELWLVRNTGDIYEIVSGSPQVYQTATYVPLYTEPVSFVVSPGRNPNAPTNIIPKIEPREDIVYLDADGRTEVVFDDYTDPGAANYVTRDVTVTMADGSPAADVQSLSGRANADEYYLEGDGNIVAPTTTSDYTVRVLSDKISDLTSTNEWYSQEPVVIDGVQLDLGERLLYTGRDTGAEDRYTRGLYSVRGNFLVGNPFFGNTASGWEVSATDGRVVKQEDNTIDWGVEVSNQDELTVRRPAVTPYIDLEPGQKIEYTVYTSVSKNEPDPWDFGQAKLRLITTTDASGDPDWNDPSRYGIDLLDDSGKLAPLVDKEWVVPSDIDDGAKLVGVWLFLKSSGRQGAEDRLTVNFIRLRGTNSDHAYVARYRGPVVEMDDLYPSSGPNPIIQVQQSTDPARAGQYVYAEPYDDFIPYRDPEGQANRSFQVEVDQPGKIIVEAEYEDPDTRRTASATKAVRVRPSLDTTLAATAKPALPPGQLLPGDGRFHVKMHQEVTLLSTPSDKGPALTDPAANSWTDSRALELARRLGVEDLDTENAPLQMLYEAGSLLVSALHRPTDSGLRRYEVTLPNGIATEGQILMLNTGAIRLTSLTSAPGDGEIWEGVGFLTGTASDDGYITGNGSQFHVDIEVTYGQTAGSGEVMQFSLQSRPERAEVEMPLPSKTPQAPGDRWHVRYRITASWEHGKQTTGTWSEWKDAEIIPTEPARVNYLNGAIHIDAKNPFGRAQWAEGRPSENMPYLANRIPTHMETRPPASAWREASNRPDFLIDLIQAADGGSSKTTLERLTVPYEEDILPVVTIDDSQSIGALDVVTGLIVRSTTGAWIGLGDRYVPFGGSVGTVIQGVDIRLGSSDNLISPAAGPGVGKFSLPAAENDTITVRIETSAPVDAINYVSGGAGDLYVASGSSPVQQNGVYTHTFNARNAGMGTKEQVFVYEAITGENYETFRFVVENSSIDITNDVEITSATGINTGADVSVTFDTSSGRTKYILTSEGGNWDTASSTLDPQVFINGRNIQTLEVEGMPSVTASVEVSGDQYQTVTFDTIGSRTYTCVVNKDLRSEYIFDIRTDT